MDRYATYWNDNPISDVDEDHSLDISVSTDGFHRATARPAGEARTVGLTLEEIPRSGVYILTPVWDGFDFRIRLEFDEEPYPEAKIHTLELHTPLSDAASGDEIELTFREDAVESPETRTLSGTIQQLVDQSGAVPEPPSYDPDQPTVLSILVATESDLSESDERLSTSDMFISDGRIPPFGEPFGTLDVVGDSEPLSLEWEGDQIAPALSVESVSVSSTATGEIWTVENDALSPVDFAPLRDQSMPERKNILDACFAKSNITPSPETLEVFAAAVDQSHPEGELTVSYDSSRSNNILTKHGTLTETRSVYYADPNRELHQIRFSGPDGRFYVLLNPELETPQCASVYSVANARHWDSELGPVTEIQFT
jgi:hypothetical protein